MVCKKCNVHQTFNSCSLDGRIWCDSASDQALSGSHGLIRHDLICSSTVEQTIIIAYGNTLSQMKTLPSVEVHCQALQCHI